MNKNSENKVLKIINKTEISKAADIDRLSGRFVRDGAEVLSRSLSEICNLSIARGVLPDACKVTKLKPIYKKKEKKTDSFNHRPISLLPIISKVIKRIVHDQTNQFLSENILYNIQSRFRPNHSTNLCLAHLTDTILTGFDEGLLTGMILTDLHKEFDTRNHEVLLQKLKAIKFLEQSIPWFRSYLCDRIFFAETDNKLFDFGKTSCGVPQGSILGLLLFLIYVNMSQAVKSNLLLYGDDLCLMYQREDMFFSRFEGQLLASLLNTSFSTIVFHEILRQFQST